MSTQAEIIESLPDRESEFRDTDDQPVLSTLLVAMQLVGANYLVTGDKDLLVLAERFPIVTPADFWAAHGGL